jgi:hypothetical protein
MRSLRVREHAAGRGGRAAFDGVDASTDPRYVEVLITGARAPSRHTGSRVVP